MRRHTIGLRQQVDFSKDIPVHLITKFGSWIRYLFVGMIVPHKIFFECQWRRVEFDGNDLPRASQESMRDLKGGGHEVGVAQPPRWYFDKYDAWTIARQLLASFVQDVSQSILTIVSRFYFAFCVGAGDQSVGHCDLEVVV